jgi:hypothetical protein
VRAAGCLPAMVSDHIHTRRPYGLRWPPAMYTRGGHTACDGLRPYTHGAAIRPAMASDHIHTGQPYGLRWSPTIYTRGGHTVCDGLRPYTHGAAIRPAMVSDHIHTGRPYGRTYIYMCAGGVRAIRMRANAQAIIARAGGRNAMVGDHRSSVELRPSCNPSLKSSKMMPSWGVSGPAHAVALRRCAAYVAITARAIRVRALTFYFWCEPFLMWIVTYL